MRAFLIAALICFTACTTAPPAPTPDPLAFPEEREAIPASLFHPEIDYPVNVHSVTGVIMQIGTPVTALCRDNWVSYPQHRRGTCEGHRGVGEWRHRPAN